MKRGYIWLLSTVLVFLLAAGCGAKEEPSGEDTEKVRSEDRQDKEQEEIKDGGKNIDSKPADLSEAEKVSVDIYYGNEDASGFEIAKETIYTLDAGQIIDKLIAYKMLPEGITFNKLETLNDEGARALKLDMPAAFAEYVASQGTSGEYMVIGSLVNTFLKAHEAEKILITVDGKALESGHAEYPSYLYFHE